MSNDTGGSRQNRTVTVACRLPQGIIIRDNVKITVEEQTPGGVRAVEQYRPIGPRIRIKGPTVPGPFIRRVEVVGGYAISEGIPADVFQRWIDWNKDSAMVRNQLIYGHENGDRVRDWAKDRDSVRSGMEPLDVSLKSRRGTLLMADERVARAGADMMVDGQVDLH